MHSFKRDFPTTKGRRRRRHGYHLVEETKLKKMIGSESQDHLRPGRSSAKKDTRGGGWVGGEPSHSCWLKLSELGFIG
jgi:hypothetical protein